MASKGSRLRLETVQSQSRYLSMSDQKTDDQSTVTISFEFDRMAVARFRETFPKARWSDTLQAWTVPGKTAGRRVDRWMASEAERRSPFEDEKGRDAYEFEPILSPYLHVCDRGFRVQTPYSRTVVDELRQIPFARWNADDKVWEIPFSSYEDLQHRWKAIEEAAQRNEPEERRKRAEARRGTEAEAKVRRRANERRRRRLPVSSEDFPPVGRPIATTAYGIVVISDITGEIVDPEEVAEHHPDAGDEHVWADWRPAVLDELVHTWPARHKPSDCEKMRGWWQPTLDELRQARRNAKSRHRRKRKDDEAGHIDR